MQDLTIDANMWQTIHPGQNSDRGQNNAPNQSMDINQNMTANQNMAIQNMAVNQTMAADQTMAVNQNMVFNQNMVVDQNMDTSQNVDPNMFGSIDPGMLRRVPGLTGQNPIDSLPNNPESIAAQLQEMGVSNPATKNPSPSQC